jgi:hypothetical protein
MKTRNQLIAELEALSAKYRQRSCHPLWLGGKAAEFLVDHWNEVKAIMEPEEPGA